MSKFRLFFLSILLILCSCIKGKQVIVLNDDGSAMVELNFTLTKFNETLFLLSQSAYLQHKEGDGRLSTFFDERAIRYYLNHNFLGVAIRSFRYQKSKNVSLYQLKLDIDNLENALKSGLFQGMSFEKYEEQKWSFVWLLPKWDKKKKFNEYLLDGLDLTLLLKASQSILDSNAYNKNDKEVSWNITGKNFKELMSRSSFYSALIKGDYSLEKSLREEQRKKDFFGLDE